MKFFFVYGITKVLVEDNSDIECVGIVSIKVDILFISSILSTFTDSSYKQCFLLRQTIRFLLGQVGRERILSGLQTCTSRVIEFWSTSTSFIITQLESYSLQSGQPNIIPCPLEVKLIHKYSTARYFSYTCNTMLASKVVCLPCQQSVQRQLNHRFAYIQVSSLTIHRQHQCTY